MWILYSSPGACALAAHIALNEVGADYDLRILSFAKQQELADDYLEINPKGRVPALITDQGVLTETSAILGFIAQSFPGSALAAPTDPFKFARIQEFNSYLCSTVHVAHAHRVRGNRWADEQSAIEEMKRKVPETVGACFQLIEDTLFAGPWVTGDHFSISDPYLYTLSTWIKDDGVDINQFPKVHDHLQRMQQRPAVIKAHAEEQSGQQ